MAIEIGALRALLSLDSAAFDRGAKRAQASMGGLQRRFSQMSQSMGRIGRKMSTRVTLPLVGIAAAAVKSSLSTVDAQSKMAQSLGTSTASMQVLARAADRAGVSTGEMEQIARQLTKRLSKAAAGGGPAAKALERIGLSAEGLADLDMDQKIATINKAIAETVPVAEQAAIATELFGSRAGIVAGRLDAATIEAARAEMERFGVTVSEIEADRIEEANDAISGLGLVTRGLANQLAVALAPTLKSIAEGAANIAARFSELSPRTQAIIAGVVAFAAAAGPLAMGIGFIAAGLAALTGPIGLVILGLAALAAAAGYVAANWDGLVAKYPALGQALEAVKAVASRTWEVLRNTVTAQIELFSQGVTAFTALINGDFAGALEQFRAMGATLADYFAETFPQITQSLEMQKTALDAFATAVGNALPEKVRVGLVAVRNHFLGLAGSITSAVGEMVPALATQGGSIAGAIAAGVAAFIDDAVQHVRDIGPRIVAALQAMGASILAAAREIGLNLVEGVKQGIEERIDGAIEAIQGAFNRITGAAKEEVEVRSPSRVFARIGRDMMAGAELGINDNAGRAASAAAAAGRNAAAAMDGAVEAAGPSKLEGYISRISDAMAQAIVDGKDMGEALRGVFKGIAKDLISSGIKSLISGIFGGFGGGGGGGGGGGFLGGIFKGFFAKGGTLGAGEWGIAGEAGPEPVVGPARIVPNSAMGGGRTELALSVDVSGARGNAEIREMVSQGVSAGLSQYDQLLPGRVSEIRNDPRARY